jgi:hypothetical protein
MNTSERFRKEFNKNRKLLKGRFFRNKKRIAAMMTKDSSYRAIILSILQFRTFPSKLEDFNTYVVNGVAYLIANSPRIVDAPDLAAMDLLFNVSSPVGFDWKTIWTKTTTGETVGSEYWNGLRSTRRHEIEQLFLDIFDKIAEATWTPLDRSTLRRPAKSTSHTSVGILDYAPTMTMVDKWHLGMKFHFHNSLTPDTDAMPANQHVAMEYFIGGKGLDPATITFGNSTDAKRFLKSLAFTEANVGSYLYVRCRYVNSKGEPSLYWSAIICELIN